MVLSLFLGIFLIFSCYYPIFFLLLHIQNMTLDKIHIGKNALITQVGGEGALRQHFLDMGLIPGAIVTIEKYAPMGDPLQIHLHGYSLTLRKADAAKITVVADVEIPEKTDPEPQNILSWNTRDLVRVDAFMMPHKRIRCQRIPC